MKGVGVESKRGKKSRKDDETIDVMTVKRNGEGKSQRKELEKESEMKRVVMEKRL